MNVLLRMPFVPPFEGEEKAEQAKEESDEASSEILHE
jgi:hypothetical protein